ncbi:hypothetical protein B0H14DRAFT_3788958 [Mycena olivaceomarginata]|nr:hypothetical protein B0H14DRAFT_3788958 [Mycena olivaceomarginata]
MPEKRAVDAHSGLKENWGRAVGRGNREGALDGRQSWWKPRNVTLVTPGNAAEASERALDGRLTCTFSESWPSVICAPRLRAIPRRQNSAKPLAIPAELSRLGPNYHAHTKKALKTTNFAGYSTSEGIYEVQEPHRFRKYFNILHIIYVIIPQIHGQYSIPRDSKHLQVCGHWNHVCARKEGGRQRVHEQGRSGARGAETKRATSAHGTWIEHGSGRQRAHRWRPSGTQGAGIESPGGGGGQREIEHRTAGNERAWGGDQAHGWWPSSTRATAIERIWSGYRGHL